MPPELRPTGSDMTVPPGTPRGTGTPSASASLQARRTRLSGPPCAHHAVFHQKSWVRSSSARSRGTEGWGRSRRGAARPSPHAARRPRLLGREVSQRLLGLGLLMRARRGPGVSEEEPRRSGCSARKDPAIADDRGWRPHSPFPSTSTRAPCSSALGTAGPAARRHPRRRRGSAATILRAAPCPEGARPRGTAPPSSPPPQNAGGAPSPWGPPPCAPSGPPRYGSPVLHQHHEGPRPRL
jgi:hypothetical protein